MNVDKKRVDRLIEYVQGIRDNDDNKELYLKYKEDIENVQPQEAFEIFYSLLEEGMDSEEILVFLDKVINVFYKSLYNYRWEKPENDNFLMDLIYENEALEKKTNIIKKILKNKEVENKKEILLSRIKELQEFNEHYLKKENILFPYLEKRMERFEGLKIMWALHDEVRIKVKEMIRILKDKESNEKEINIAIGKLFFAILGLVKKENLILFPSASEVLSNQDWYEMHKQSLEYGFPFIDKKREDIGDSDSEIKYINSDDEKILFRTETGELELEQVLMIFNQLPVDLTFVDENNKVKYFTKPKDRVFSRSPAIIGRDVKNCHPPNSVHIVNKIIESFRSGEKDNARFWIDLKGRKILIQYFPLRNSNGEYKGVLEVSQDITEIQKLEGENRLLDWKIQIAPIH
ncbi:DUF438 domain-containing protein [Clostridium sp. D2Q-14]|uniref:DUF438 domain-containing protein n=1 Tax=Anaeromonas gelatinilytica TaxID=2683194 RepID=UPI00193BB0C6|nr:PAS domain-containing protein [Anaeromonas gelatinilytica]MBS4535048.1 DUF438 domain-containing protein [Anaeromonas gelatinilytica]